MPVISLPGIICVGGDGIVNEVDLCFIIIPFRCLQIYHMFDSNGPCVSLPNNAAFFKITFKLTLVHPFVSLFHNPENCDLVFLFHIAICMQIFKIVKYKMAWSTFFF